MGAFEILYSKIEMRSEIYNVVDGDKIGYEWIVLSLSSLHTFADTWIIVCTILGRNK